MITVKFYSFSKRLNSTKQPTGGTDLSCLVKSDSSIVNPVIELSTDPTGYNYCYIASFNRYYYIDDIVFAKGIWDVYCHVDVLASYKTAIGNSTQYVLRSSARKDTNLIDNLYPLSTSFSETWLQPYSNDMTWEGFDHGVYVIGVQGNNSGNTGIVYYELTPAQFKSLIDTFWALAGDSTAIQRYGQLMANSLLNLSDYLVSCVWLPKSVTIEEQYSQVKLGNIVVTSGKVCTGYPTVIWSCIFDNIIEHPQINDGQYMHYPPYTQYKFISPFIGNIDIPFSWLQYDTIHHYCLFIHITPDFTTGEGIFRIYKYNESVTPMRLDDVIQLKCQVGVNIPISTLDLNIGTLAGAAGGIGNVISGLINGNPGQVGSGVLSGIGNAADFYNPEARLLTGSSGFVKYAIEPTLYCKFAFTGQHDNAKYGSPLCQSYQISTLGGYVICDNAEFADGLESERSSIVAYLNGGIYYE